MGLVTMSTSFPKAGQKISEQKFCRSCGNGLEHATISVNEILKYLRSDGYLSIRDAASYLGLSRRFLDSRLGEIPHYRPGAKKLFKRSDLDWWMEQYRKEPITQKDLKALLSETVQKVLAKRNKR
jgi:excisionase family DNA binding protein